MEFRDRLNQHFDKIRVQFLFDPGATVLRSEHLQVGARRTAQYRVLFDAHQCHGQHRRLSFEDRLREMVSKFGISLEQSVVKPFKSK